MSDSGETTVVRTGMRSVPGQTPPEWVIIARQDVNKFRVRILAGPEFDVSARTDEECMAAIADWLRRRR